MGNGDNFALDWIRGELESTLDQARAALESYAEGGREETRLRSCLTSLHQVHGTLRMLELEGVVLLADHMEQTAQSLLNGSIQEALSAEQSLMQAILQLPAFIEEVQNGVTEDLPLVMPYVNELRACCGLSAMQLTPQVSAEFTPEQAAEAMRRFRGINGSEKASRVRAAYQQVLLSVLKGRSSIQTVETLGKVAIGMQRICEGAPLATLWKALEHFARGYAADPQKMSSEAVRDLRRVDAEMKRVVTEGAEVLVEPLPLELVRDLLRAAEAHGQRDEQITELRSAVQTPQASQVKPREALEQASGVLVEEIAAVRDRFDLFARGSHRSAAELSELTSPLDNICSTLSMLGDQHGADLLRVQRAQILSLDESDTIGEEQILAIASALVQTEQGLTGGGEIASSDEALSNAALNEAQIAVLEEARSGIDQVKQSIVDFVSSKWNTGYLDDSRNVVTAVQGALKMIPLPRAAALLENCGTYIEAQLLEGHRPDWQELDAFADALGGIDYYLERLFETGRVPGDQALDLTQESLNRLAEISGADVAPITEQDAEASVEAGSYSDALVDSAADSDTNTDTENPVASDDEEPPILEPLDGAGGDSALTAMLGARPEELAFVADSETEPEQSAETDTAQTADAESQDDAAADVSDTGLDADEVAPDEVIGAENDSVAEQPADDMLELVDFEPEHDPAVDFSTEADFDLEADAELEGDDAAGETRQLTVDEAVAESVAEQADVDTNQTSFVDTSATDDSPASFGDHAEGSAGAIAAGGLLAAGALGSIANTADTNTADTTDTADAEAVTASAEPASNESEDPDSQEVDPEIVEIFVEEVDEVLEAIEAQLPDWSQDLSAEKPLTEIRRSFHTLKGSGRIVGANQIGELGWALENMLNRLLDGTITATEDHLFLVSHACTIVPPLRSDFANRVSAEHPELVELLEQVDVLASGGALSRALANTVPVVDDTLDEPTHQVDEELAEEDFPIWDDGGLDSFEPTPPNVDVPSFLAAGEDSAAHTDSLLTADEAMEPAHARELFVAEVQEHLEVLSTRIRDSLADDELELDSPFTRALHTIAGSAATAGELAVVGIAEPLQDVASAVLRERDGLLDSEYLVFVREGVYALQRLLDAEVTADEVSDDSAIFAAESERLLGGLLETPESSTSLLEMEETAVLLDAREFLDGWRFGSMDLERAAQMNRALTHVIDRAHSDELADLAEVLLLSHNQFAHQPLSEERHYALVAAHDDLLVQLDALAAGQVATVKLENLEQLQGLLGSQEPVEPLPAETPEAIVAADDETLDEDAQEAISYQLDQSEAFDLEALDDDIFADSDTDDLPAVEDFSAQDFMAPANETELASESIAPAQPEAAPAADSQPQLAASAESDDDEFDPELLAIFFEEADEILEDFDNNVQDWSADRQSKVYLENLLRGLHTLKGGARLAGLGALGDMTHDFESELIELQNAEADVSDERFDGMQQRYDELVEAVARAQNNEEVVEQADHLAVASDPSTAADEAESTAQVRDPAPFDLASESLTQDVEAEFATDVEAAFSADTDSADADVEPQAAEFVAATNDDAEDVVEVVSVTPSTDDLNIPVPAAFKAPEEAASAEAAGTQEEDRSRSSQEMVRVSAGLLENLVNLAGESSIVRARVEQGISDFGGALEEMETTIERVREQLRRLEIETETRVSSRVERSAGPAYEDFDPLEMDRYSQLQQLTRSLTESATDMMDLKETLRYRARESETLLLQQARLNTELQEGLMRTRMVPFSRLMPRLRRIVRQVSRDLDKQVEFQAYNAEGELDRNVLERMVPPLEHMLRNAIDHGIEAEDLRHSFGKPTIGRIGLKLSREGGDVVIEITDDGAGIDVETVREKAIERKLMAADAVLSDEEVLDFVLAPGFSTAKSLTQISGRGVGMDVVHSEVKQLGGSIAIASEPGRGTSFTVRLPFTVSVNRALMVTLGEDQYAIPLNTIEGIVLLQSDDLSKHYGPDGAPFEYAGVPYRVRYLGSYLGREYVARGEQTSVPVVLVRSGDQAVAVHVDDVQGSREIVVKSLGPQFAGVGGISGATILGDGSVVIILDLLSLMRARGPGKSIESRQPPSADEERWVLVVDDSVTVRKVTSRLLERQGMNVMTAKDGVEAVSVLQERQPDIVLLDIEMPRMDGFEVARQMRRDERLAEIPVVMISSRTGEKHTERARTLGVKRFLGKPFQENELLEIIDELVTRS